MFIKFMEHANESMVIEIRRGVASNWEIYCKGTEANFQG